MILLIVAFTVGLATTAYLVPLLIGIAKKFGIMDNPDGNLKKHKHPTPYLGGIALYGGLIISLAVTSVITNDLILLIMGSTILLIVGLIDDVLILKPSQKFIGQIIATICFINMECISSLCSVLAMKLFTILWILSIINAFNLVDVMDGLATILAIIPTIFFLYAAFFFDNLNIVIVLLAFLGALVGFGWYNRPVARIYLGDAGSLFIGGFLATIPLALPWTKYNLCCGVVPIIILLIPLLEVSTLIFIRLSKGIPFYQGSPDHFSIYLKKKGWTIYQILTYSFVISVILGIIGTLFMLNIISFNLMLIKIVTLIIFWYAILFINRHLVIKLVHF